MLRPRFFIMLPGLLALLCGFAIAASGPFLRISEREVDFGRVEQFQSLQHQIMLGNEGDAPLRILKVESSCGCTVAVPSDSIILPGRAASLDIMYGSKDASGVQEKRIVLRTNDPAEPTVTIIVRADVHTLIRLDEDLVRFDPLKVGTTASKRVRVSADKSPGLEIAKIEGGEKILETKMTREDTADEAVIWLDLKIRPDAPAGIFRETLRLVATKPKSATAKLTVAGSIVSYFVVPGEGRLRLTPIRVGETTDNSILITCDGSQPYKLVRVDTGVPFLKGEILPRDEKSFDLKITLLPVTKDGMIQQPIKIVTTDPKQPIIRLVVQGVVRK